MLPFTLALGLFLAASRRCRKALLIATKLWALAHLLANGSAADVLLFGSFLFWAGAVRISLKFRVPRPIRMLPATVANDTIAVVGGLALYAAFVLWLHARLVGVPPVPGLG
jgi:uncharacterized membrane protein